MLHMYPESSVNRLVGNIYHPTLKNCCLKEKFSLNNQRYRRTNTGKRTMLEFNIGPSFLHMIFYNNFTGRSFSYLFDYSNCVSSNIIKDKVKQTYLQTRVNTEKSFVLKLDIFKEKCGCGKCLSASFLFYGSQPVNLINELVTVLKSEHCCNWNRCWIEMVLEQMFIFFSCIKNGVIHERLLECACDCAHLLVMKHSKTDLLEYKYSYRYFKEKLIANVQPLLKYRNKNNRIINHSIYCGREIGTVYFDLVETFVIMTFETETEMNAYTKYENKIRNTKPEYFINLFRKSINACDLVETSRKATKSEVTEISNKLREKDEVVLMKLCKRSERATEWIDKRVFMLMKQFQYKKSTENRCNNNEPTFVNGKIKTINVSSSVFTDEFCLENRTDRTPYSKEEDNSGSVVEHREKDVLARDCCIDIAEWNSIPVIHHCNNIVGVGCTCKSLSLGMMLNLGNRRALPKEAIENLQLLENNHRTVTYRMATIAASALVNHEKATVKRIIVPVVLSDIVVKLAKHLKWQRVSGRETTLDDSKLIDKDVQHLMSNLIDEICCSEAVDLLSERVDSDRMLKDSLEEDEGKLGEPDTVIKSNDQVQNESNISRVSERSKREIKMSSRFINSVFFDEASLPLATSVFQGSRSLGTQRRMEFVCDDRRKRRLKSLGDECLKRKMELTSDVCKKRKMDMVIDAWKKRGSSTVLRKLDFSVGNIDEKKTLADILIWCAHHDKYNCPCILNVCRMKHNLLIWQPPKILKYVTYKVMSKVDIKQKYSCEVYFFDSDKYCARTYGTPVNYSVRNNSELFSAKRRYELENNVTASTNSFIKLKYLIFKSLNNSEDEDGYCTDDDDDDDDDDDEQYDDVIRYECKENVFIAAEKQDEDGCCSEEEINITDDRLPSDYNGRHNGDIIVISDNEDDTTVIQSNNTNLAIRKVTISNVDVDQANLSLRPRQITKHLLINDKSTSPKTYLKSNRKLSKEKIADNDQHSNLDVDQANITRYRQITKHLTRNDESASPKTYLKIARKLSNEKICDSDRHSNLETLDNDLEENVIRNSNIREQSIDAKILEKGLQKRNIHGIASSVEIGVKSPLKQLKTYLFQQNSIDITNYDSTLENCLLRLKDHPLKDDIYCENKLPKLALYCVTPGIGYLPIVEYTAKALVVFDPIFPQVLHSFKNLTAANMWLNKFLKDFLVFESIDISLKWIIVKPGIIKIKQSQPFSPAIFEYSPIIITKDGQIRFSKKELIAASLENKRQEFGEYKRKLVGDTVVDINGSDGKRKKIHLDSLGGAIAAANILTRTVNLVQQYPSKKCTIIPTGPANAVINAATATQLFHQNTINSEINNSSFKNNINSTLNSANKEVSLLAKQLNNISPTKHYQLIPANLFIQMNVSAAPPPPSLLKANNNSLNSPAAQSKYNSSGGGGDGGTGSISSHQSPPFILSNNDTIITTENPSNTISSLQ